jgi:DNA polymerase-3 subunit gamma/tau
VAGAPAIALAELDSANWALLLEQLGLVGIIYNTASHCELRHCKDGKLEFILDEPRAALFNEGHVDKIRLALENYFEAELSVSIAPGEIQVESPAMRCERLALERQQQAVAEIEGDPVLQGFIARFDGELDPASIAPLDQ